MLSEADLSSCAGHKPLKLSAVPIDFARVRSTMSLKVFCNLFIVQFYLFDSDIRTQTEVSM
jgi:hypothetical protein